MTNRLLYYALILFSATAAFGGDGSIRPSPRPLPETYIVRLSDSLSGGEVRKLAMWLAREHAGKLRFVWDSVIPGFSIEVPEAAARAIARNPHVVYVEEVGVGEVAQSAPTSQWHLDRLDQRMGTNGTYIKGCETEGVNVYVVDTGIRATHQTFLSSTGGSRVIAGYNARIGSSETQARALNPCPGENGVCGNLPGLPKYCLGGGHGTSVASIIGGRTYGVYTKVNLIAVRTHSCADGTSTTDVVANALNWIYNDYPTRRNAAGQQIPAVVNMSFGFEVATADVTMMEEKINRLIIDRNITVVAAAHNKNTDATTFSPARMARGNNGRVISVGASTRTDRRWVCNYRNSWENPSEDGSATACGPYAAGSNWGAAVDIFAPGQNVRSATIKESFFYLGVETCCRDSDTAERQFLLSGTSFAAPIVAGVAARHLFRNPTETPDQIWSRILAEATGDGGSWSPLMTTDPTDVNSGPLYNSPNRLLFKAGMTFCNATSNTEQ